MRREYRNGAGELFDHHAEDYGSLVSRSVFLSGEGVEYFARYKLERIRTLRNSSPPGHILDVGCGTGLLTELLSRAFPSARVTGVDLSQKCLDQAASRCAGLTNVAFRICDGGSVPAEIEGVDLVVIANVLHHVEPTARPIFLEEVALPALLPGGRIVVFEHNPYNPITRLVVQSCSFDQDARLLSLSAAVALLQNCRLRIDQRDYIVFFPRFLRFLRGLEGLMGWLPVGAQYMVVGSWDPPPGTAKAYGLSKDKKGAST